MSVKEFVDWLIENEDLDNAWWFDGWIKYMFEKYQSL